MVSSSDIIISHINGNEYWLVPPSKSTTYFTHGYARYIGKFPPQIPSKLIDEYYNGSGKILDPMVGGGTVLIESVLRGIPCEGWDINPYSLLVSRCATRYVDLVLYQEVGDRIIQGLAQLNNKSTLSNTCFNKWSKKGMRLKYCSEYFDQKTTEELEYALNVINDTYVLDKDVADLLLLTVLSTLRRISYANVKKMNVELDMHKKTKKSLLDEFTNNHNKISKINRDLPENFKKGLVNVHEQDAIHWSSDEKYDMIIIHPPYLTNTAFSEATMLQLAILDICHKDIWKKELRCRGSFLHETNGLQKYLVNWAKIMGSAANSIKDNGTLAVVVGDGQIHGVRIPVGAISIEYAKDLGLTTMKHSYHQLVNNTGRTQNKKMVGQHVIVFKKS